MSENRLGSLAKQTAIYGLSSIIGRFLNYMLVPVYTFKICAEAGGPAAYGIVTNLYAYTALLLVLLTFFHLGFGGWVCDIAICDSGERFPEAYRQCLGLRQPP